MNRSGAVPRSILPLMMVAILAGPLAGGESNYDELRISLKQDILRLVNRDRRAHGLSPVELDPRASAIADEYCQKQLRYRTTGHFTVDGLAPYMRYSLGGGNDGLSENTAAWSANYRFSDAVLADLVARSQQTMMAEQPPDDGHRRAILDPSATHVGIGLAWKGGELRMAQEFLRRYIDWSQPAPRSAQTGEKAWIAGKPMAGYRVEAITVHHERAPQPLLARAANRITGYALPATRRDYLPQLPTLLRRDANGRKQIVAEHYEDGRPGDFPVARDGSFSFGVPLNDGPGIYTLVVWVRKPGEERLVSASNVSIRVSPAALQDAGQVVGR